MTNEQLPSSAETIEKSSVESSKEAVMGLQQETKSGAQETLAVNVPTRRERMKELANQILEQLGDKSICFGVENAGYIRSRTWVTDTDFCYEKNRKRLMQATCPKSLNSCLLCNDIGLVVVDIDLLRSAAECEEGSLEPSPDGYGYADEVREMSDACKKMVVQAQKLGIPTAVATDTKYSFLGDVSRVGSYPPDGEQDLNVLLGMLNGQQVEKKLYDGLKILFIDDSPEDIQELWQKASDTFLGKNADVKIECDFRTFDMYGEQCNYFAELISYDPDIIFVGKGSESRSRVSSSKIINDLREDSEYTNWIIANDADGMKSPDFLEAAQKGQITDTVGRGPNLLIDVLDRFLQWRNEILTERSRKEYASRILLMAGGPELGVWKEEDSEEIDEFNWPRVEENIKIISQEDFDRERELDEEDDERRYTEGGHMPGRIS